MDLTIGHFTKCYMKSTDSKRMKLKLLLNFCFQCLNGTQKEEQVLNRCLTTHGYKWMQIMRQDSQKKNLRLIKRKRKVLISSVRMKIKM